MGSPHPHPLPQQLSASPDAPVVPAETLRAISP